MCGVCQYPSRPAVSIVAVVFPGTGSEDDRMGGTVVCPRCVGQTLNVLRAVGVVEVFVHQLPSEDGAEIPAVTPPAG